MANPPPHYGGPYWTFLKLTSDDGISGYGEAYGVPFSPRRTRQLIEDVVARHVIGKSPFDIETIWRIVYSSGFGQHPEHTLGGVLSGIEIACWDLVPRRASRPSAAFTRRY